MKTNPITIEKYNGTLKELARDIADLRYDVLQEFLSHLSSCIYVDAQKDKEKNRIQLYENLMKCSDSITEARMFIIKAWQICFKYVIDYKKEKYGKHNIKSKYDHWKELYWEENEEDIIVTWEYFNNNYNWCDKCKSYQEESCICYAR
jgi:hypothetical protein